MKVTITIRSRLPLSSALSARLDARARELVGEVAEKVAEKYRAVWTGWKYEGRPPSAPRDVSRPGWVAVQDTSGASASVINRTGDYRSHKSYVLAVHRKGETTPAWKEHYDADIRPMLPPLWKHLHTELLKVVRGG